MSALTTDASWQPYVDDVVFVVSVLAVAIVVTRVGTISVRRLQRRMESAHSAKQELALQRAATVAHALNYAVRVTVWSIAVLTLLGRANIQLGPLIAGAGVVGVALGFGAQSIVRDYLAGFYLLIEDQLDVGDAVEILVAGVKLTGTVTELTLRTTWLRTGDGEVHIVPNGGIAYVTNRSRGEGEVRVNVKVEPGRDPAELRRIVEDLLSDVRRDPELRLAVFDGPTVARIDETGDAVEIEIVATARPERREQLAGTLRQRLEHRLRPLGQGIDVNIPTPESPQTG